MGAVEVSVRQDLCEGRLLRSVQQVEDDDAFCRLIYRFTVNKMILKYQSGRKHELNDMMKQAKGKELWIPSKSKPDDFHYVQYEHDGGSFWTDRLPAQILKGLEAEGHPGLREQFTGACEPPRYEDMPKDIATQISQYLAQAQ